LASKPLIEIIKGPDPLSGFHHLDGKGIEIKRETKYSLGFTCNQKLIEGRDKLETTRLIGEIEKS